MVVGDEKRDRTHVASSNELILVFEEVADGKKTSW